MVGRKKRVGKRTINDHGAVNLVNAVFKSAKKDYISNYIDYKMAEYNLKKSGEFFESDIFASALAAAGSDMSTEDYVRGLELQGDIVVRSKIRALQTIARKEAKRDREERKKYEEEGVIDFNVAD